MVRIPGDFQVNKEPITRSMFTQDQFDWWYTMLNLEEVHKHVTGKGVSIAILDTGYYPHPDLKGDGQIMTFVPEDDHLDTVGHGTHVAGLIGMQPNGKGYIGTAPGATLHIGKVLNGAGEGQVKWLDEALTWVLDNEFDWVSGSLALDRPIAKIEKKINQLKEKGIGCNFAVGNESRTEISFPASLEHCIASGAHDAAKLPADFNNIGKKMILGPGVHVKSSWIDGSYRSASGSSMATPIITGLCGLITELERNYGS